MTDRPTASTITDAQLDRLHRELDEARQSAAAIAAQRDRLRQRMNALADRWEHALAPDKSYARALRAEISVAPFDPEGAMAVQEYTEHGRRLWAFRCWGTETCDGWLGLGHHTETSAWRERERHVAEKHTDRAAQPNTDHAPLRDHLAAALIARIKRATVSEAQPFGPLTSLLAANEFDLADTAIAALLEYLDIGDAEAWCKVCRRVWDGKQHRCESDAEQHLAQAEELLSVAHGTSNKSEAERAGADQRAEQMAATLREVLDAFRSVTDDGTRTLVGYVSAPIHPDDMARWRAVLDPVVEPVAAVCSAYQPPATPEDSGLCAGCGMSDYKHREGRDA